MKNYRKKEGQISYIEKVNKEFILNNKEDLPIKRAVRTTKRNLYDKGLFNVYSHEVLKAYLFVNERSRSDLEE